MLKISKHLNWYQYSNKLVIRNLRSSEIFSIDDSLKEVWLLISKGHNYDEIYFELQKIYNIPNDDLHNKIDHDIHALSRMDLIYNSPNDDNKKPPRVS